MPNTGHYTICPYFLSERSKAITCEDVFRRFKDKKEKDDWMHMFCDDQWQKCKYAQNLHALHERINKKGDNERMIELLRHKIQATREELKKVSTQLGKAESKRDKQEDVIKYLKARDETAVKRIADLQEENNALMESVEKIREKNRELFDKWQSEKQKNLAKEEKLLQEMLEQASIFEGYIAYLLHSHGEDQLDVEAAFEWADHYGYAIYAGEYTDDKRLKTLKLAIEEVGKETDDGDNRSSGEIPEASNGEDAEGENKISGEGTEEQ